MTFSMAFREYTYVDEEGQLVFYLQGPIYNKSAQVQVMVCYMLGAKPLHEPVWNILSTNDGRRYTYAWVVPK